MWRNAVDSVVDSAADFRADFRAGIIWRITAVWADIICPNAAGIICRIEVDMKAMAATAVDMDTQMDMADVEGMAGVEAMKVDMETTTTREVTEVGMTKVTDLRITEVTEEVGMAEATEVGMAEAGTVGMVGMVGAVGAEDLWSVVDMVGVVKMADSQQTSMRTAITVIWAMRAM